MITILFNIHGMLCLRANYLPVALVNIKLLLRVQNLVSLILIWPSEGYMQIDGFHVFVAEATSQCVVPNSATTILEISSITQS